MNFLVYLLVFLISLYFLYQRKYGQRNKLLAKLPSPPRSIPFFNHSIYFMGKTYPEIFQVLMGFHESLPPVWRLDLNPFISNVYVRDPKIVEEILSSQKLIDKGDEYGFVSLWLGDGLIFSTGNKWFQRRKILTPAFHFKILEQFVDVMERHGDILIKKLERYEGRKIDIFSTISLYALDVICESAMGYELRAQEDETSEYVKAVKEISTIIFHKLFNPLMRIKLVYQFTRMHRREQALLKILHQFTLSVISARRKDSEKLKQNSINTVDEFGIKKKTAFLDLLLQVEVDGKPLDDESIREEVDTFMFAGHDTTSSGLTFILLNLAKNQHIQQRVLDESHEIFGDDLNRPLSMQDLNKLSYLEKVIKESLRLYPPVPAYARNFREDVVLGNYTFPANCSTKISMFGMGRDPTLFPNPKKFDPSRFDDENETIRLFSYVLFSAGPRNCIGQRFAMLEMKSIVTKIVRNFQILVDEADSNPNCAHEVVLRPIGTVDLQFKVRSTIVKPTLVTNEKI